MPNIGLTKRLRTLVSDYCIPPHLGDFILIDKIFSCDYFVITHDLKCNLIMF